ncbi:mechanosensitive ion channel family protein [Chloroflexota bacterium]
MPTFDFNLDLSAIIAGALKVVVILVIVFILVLVIRRVIPRLINARIPKIREEAPDQLAVRSKTLSQIIVQVVSAIIWIGALIMILSVLAVNIAPLIVGVGVAGLALGFAAQNIVRDYLHGFFIIMEDWYRVGEVAVIQGTGGLVENITLRRTVLRDINGTMHIFPNSRVEQASNMTRDWSRVNLDLSVAYKENLDNVIRVVNEVGQGMKDDPTWGPDLLTAPAVTRVNNLGDHGVEIKILADTKPIKQWGLMGELRKRLKDRFDEEGIEIPWPHTKVYFGNAHGEIGKDHETL